MIDVINIASYICQHYKEQFGLCIDEMKLHKLLYLSQRESIVQTGNLCFPKNLRHGDMNLFLLVFVKCIKMVPFRLCLCQNI